MKKKKFKKLKPASGVVISFSSEVPATQDLKGYEALKYTEISQVKKDDNKCKQQ